MHHIHKHNNIAIFTATRFDYDVAPGLRTAMDPLIVDNFVGRAVFDLVVCNGLNSNRFISVDFDGEKFTENTCGIYNPDPEFLASANQVLVDHPDWITNSVLSQAEQANFLNTTTEA